MDCASVDLASAGWQAPVRVLRGIGPRQEERLRKLGIERLQQLLMHLPLRYEDRTRLWPIAQLRPGRSGMIEGEILASEVKYGRRRQLVCHLADGSGHLLLRFFHFGPAQRDALQRGRRLRAYGEVRAGPSGPEMVHPECRYLGAEESPPLAAELTPIYPTTEGLQQASLRRLMEQAMDLLERDQGQGLASIPGEWLAGRDLPSIGQALRLLHRPPLEVSAEALLDPRHPARRRLALEELVAHHLSLRRLRAATRSVRAPAMVASGALQGRLIDSLPFRLTGAQQRVAAEIDVDLAQPVPMLRLVQGDVGAGKTVIAALAALRAVEAGYQAAIMAPTELLAEQHLRNFSAWLAPLGLAVCWLSGRQAAAERRRSLAALESGEVAVAVGTHALFQNEVRFQRLGLVVIDEQHRFGVHQRLALREKGDANIGQPHQLVMTATPIPRSLAMTAYADLDLSVLDELPPGRRPVVTAALSNARRDEVIQRVEKACGEGRQAYWVCTLIDESEQLEAQAAEHTAALLQEALPGIRVGLVHGRLKPAERDLRMSEFKAGRIQLLVATTVIEVGVDVPNASLMIIENAERLGLSQLHQLRGRVGRGAVESHCLLLYKPPLGEVARQRLGVLRASNDGFEVAQRDLELRGPGELLGTRQTGALNFQVADLVRDGELMPLVHRIGERMERECPQAIPDLVQAWVRGAERFAQV